MEDKRFDSPIKPGYYICDLMRECIDEFYDVCAHLLDPPEGMPPTFQDLPLSYIYKEFRRLFKRLRKCNRNYNRMKSTSLNDFKQFMEQRKAIEAIPVENLPAQVTPSEDSENG